MFCPVCTHRVSEWQMSTGKAIVINGLIFHIACLGDITIKEFTEKELTELANRRLSE